jgi:hypothetical protein
MSLGFFTVCSDNSRILWFTTHGLIEIAAPITYLSRAALSNPARVIVTGK